MPKSSTKLAIKLDLLKPQSNPEKLPIKLIRWLLSTGRFMFVFVEAVVLAAFILRFKLDADLSSKKEAIETQIPYIESLRPYEILIRQTQLKLSNIDSIKKNSVDYPTILKKIADQTPIGVKVTNISLGKNVGQATIQINAQALTTNDLSTFLAGLKMDQSLSDVTLTSIGLEQGVINFTITAAAPKRGKSL